MQLGEKLRLVRKMSFLFVSDITIGQWPLLVKQVKVVPTARVFLLAVGTNFTCCGYEPFLDTGNKR